MNQTLTNCVNCGAPLHGNICEYCGTEYGQNLDKKDFCMEDVDVWTDCEGVLHRSVRKKEGFKNESRR